MKFCRIIHNLPVSTGFQLSLSRLTWQTAKAVGAGILIALLLIEIWAFFWFMCALDDVCYAANTGGV